MKRIWTCCAAFLLCATLASRDSVAKDLVIHAGALLDGVSLTAQHQVSITVRENRIMSVQQGYSSVPAPRSSI